MENKKYGRVTIPTDLDVVPETLEIMKRWGADAIRDCDGTDFPAELRDQDAKIYSTYYTTRKDNDWAKANPDEVQQCYIMTGFHTATGDTLAIELMKGISPELMEVNTRDDIKRWWEVMDRTTGEVVPCEKWDYNAETGCVVIAAPDTPQNRVTAAKAADELLNIAGAEASIVIYPTVDGAVFASARSIGELNVQLIMEKLGGGGNRAAAAARMTDISFEDAVKKLYTTIDEYLDD